MEETKVGSAEPVVSVSDGSQEIEQVQSSVSDAGEKSVSYETHRRLLAQRKSAVEKLEALEAKAAQLEADKLEAEGSKDQLIEKLKSQLASKDKQYKDAIGSYAFTSVKSQLEAEATKLGCVDTDALTKLVDLETLEVDKETFRADSDQIKMLVDEAKQARPYLFSKSGPKLDPHVLKTGDTSAGPADIDKLSSDELKQKIMEIDSQLN